jgi:hypothetical protein
MPTLSWMRVLRHAAGVAVVLMAIAPGAAAAQSNDPPQGSPSAKVYEIPLDDARRDAAPSDGGRGGAVGTAPPGRTQSSTARDTGANPSPIRSENNFGSSSTVPGTAPAAGGNSALPRDDVAAGRLLGASVAGTATPSKTRAYLVLLLALGAAVGLGVASRYLARGR